MASLPLQDVHGDWQTLIILDACRVDAFRTVARRVGLRGDLEAVWSPACETVGWYRLQWPHRYPDVTLLTSTPITFVTTYGIDRHFAAVEPLWRTDEEDLADGRLDAVHCLDAAIHRLHAAPDRRYLIHLIPPHLPFIDDAGRAFLAGLGYPTTLHGVALCHTLAAYGKTHGFHVLRGYYEASLAIILRLLHQHRDAFPRDTVITSDHGELIGEHGYYFHGAEGTYYPVTPALHEVPWFRWSMP